MASRFLIKDRHAVSCCWLILSISFLVVVSLLIWQHLVCPNGHRNSIGLERPDCMWGGHYLPMGRGDGKRSEKLIAKATSMKPELPTSPLGSLHDGCLRRHMFASPRSTQISFPPRSRCRCPFEVNPASQIWMPENVTQSLLFSPSTTPPLSLHCIGGLARF